MFAALVLGVKVFEENEYQRFNPAVFAQPN
jgi:hypothetical protein